MARKHEQIVYKISELVEMGYPRRAVEMACHSQYAPEFAQRTSPRGRWYITLKAFQKRWDDGSLVRR